jgi:hypothetical protein
MPDVIEFPPKSIQNKSRPCDRAAHLAPALVAEVFRHIVERWDSSDDFDFQELNQRIAAILRSELAGRIS